MRIEDQRHVVVIGIDDESLSELGLRLARRLHRPFLDNCGLPGIRHHDHRADPGAQDRLDRMLAQSTPSVITVSTDNELSMPERRDRGELLRPWVVVVGRDESIGVRDDGVRADMILDPAETADDDVIDRVAETFHSVHPRR